MHIELHELNKLDAEIISFQTDHVHEIRNTRHTDGTIDGISLGNSEGETEGDSLL